MDARSHRDAEQDRGRSWSERLTRGGAGQSGLALASFLESTVVPIPIETLIAPLMIAHHRRALMVAFAVWLGSLGGALAFYLLGNLLFAPLVAPGLELLGLAEAFEAATQRLDESRLFWSVFLVSLSPAPLQLATLGAGSLGADPALFLAAIGLSRGLRYFGLAALALLLGRRLLALQRWGRGRFVLATALGLLAAYLLYQLLI